ncbi:MAG: hypothetical protein PHY16_07690 [Methylobacter sp.]|nr:hypothetical protein [Methylobacter sp.]
MPKLFFISVLLACALTGCVPSGPALIKQQSDTERSQQTCLDVFTAAEQAVLTAGVMDTEASRIEDYPYLRVNRFLSSFRDEVTDESYDFWLKQLQELANKGWRVEVRNLPKSSRQKLQSTVQAVLSSRTTTIEALQNCSDKLLRLQIESSRPDDLKELAVVADNYQTWKRVIGLYPLTAWAFKTGIAQWHEQTLTTYRQPLHQLQVSGQLIRYEPPLGAELSNSMQIAEILKKSSENPLKIPLPANEDQQLLFNSFAPLFEIDVAANDDRIGYPDLQTEVAPRINTSRPAVFQHLSHTRLGNKILLQLNYTIWFPSRPKSSVFDLMGGRLDGITWRVTLLPDGKPWIFDTIHNCGCYHLLFPSQYARAIRQETGFAESYFQPQPALAVKQIMKPVLRIAATTHYIERVYFGPGQAKQVVQYQWDNADNLRSLRLNDENYRSLFGQDGIVAATERSERYLFWPMGIPEPGAMRQWGHHAIAFVGRRHFDDARLFEGHFEIN